jgi:hypothetical protein
LGLPIYGVRFSGIANSASCSPWCSGHTRKQANWKRSATSRATSISPASQPWPSFCPATTRARRSRGWSRISDAICPPPPSTSTTTIRATTRSRRRGGPARSCAKRRCRGKASSCAALSQVEADVLVLADGDGTYDAASAPELVSLLCLRQLDMVVGAREPVEQAAYPLRGKRPQHSSLFRQLVLGCRGDALADRQKRSAHRQILARR